MASHDGASITWLGHATLLVTTPAGARLVVDPWLQGNPSVPEDRRTIEQADAVLLTHGHADHISDAVAVATATGAPTVSSPEIAAYLAGQGVEQRIEMNKGGTVEVGGAAVTMVPADHSSGITVGDGEPNADGGDPVGLIVRAPGMPTLYLAGDTGVFGDMALIAELYAPSIGVLPIDGRYNMGPFEAAHACRLLRLERVVPVHWGTFPIFTGTPDGLAAELDRLGVDCTVVALEPGQSAPLAAEAVR